MYNFIEWFINILKSDKPSGIKMKNSNETSKNRIKCALVIGHKKTSQGAYNKKFDMHEFEFNETLSKNIESQIDKTDIDIYRIYRRTYASLPNDINELNPDFVISLHCNAFNKKATGSEVLYYHKSEKGKKFATILQRNLLKYLNLKNRDIREKSAEDRGGYLLKSTNAPCIISEPFFIDNDSDYQIAAIEKYDLLIKAYTQGIIEIASMIQRKI